MSKLIFKACKFLSDSEENAEMYLTDKDTRSWVDFCDGKEVWMVNFMMGKIPSGDGYNIYVHIDWCGVIEDAEI